MTTHQFDAYAALEKLRDRYASYLLDTFGIRSSALASQLREHWTDRSDGFSLLGPTLVQPAFPYEHDCKIESLRAPGPEPTGSQPLHPRTVAMLEKGLDFPLFVHQVQAIKQASAGKTTVLSAGTGSGKTEAFLVSAIDALHWAEARGEDNLDEPGIRAVVIYPLNALVNNQIARLQHLLKGQTRLRFAFYTSRLPETYRRACKWYEKRGQPLPPECQILDRRTLRGVEVPADRPFRGPPHILVTNFSMLEYMLIRPLDRSIFLPEHINYRGNPRLRVVVLDEAHVYAGAQATEIHMLLRRAALRFGTRIEDIQGIATSATLAQGGDETDQQEKLREYGARMFGKASSYVAPILAKPYLPEIHAPVSNRGRIAIPDVPPDREIIPSSIRTIEFDGEGRPVALVRDPDGARELTRAALLLGIATDAETKVLPADEREVPALVAYRLLAQSEAIRSLRARVASAAGATMPSVDELAEEVFGRKGEAERRATDAVLRLGALARRTPKEHPLLPTRMHAWLRAPAGVWTSVKTSISADWPWGPLSANPPVDAKTAAEWFEVLVCETCGREYLLAFRGLDEWAKPVYSGLASEQSDILAFAVKENGDVTLPWGDRRGCCIPLQRQQRSRRVYSGACVFCGDTHAQITPISMNPRAALGAIVDGVFPFLAEHPFVSTNANAHQPGRGRRLLTFSDSRQEAARVAHDVEFSHDAGLTRALVYRALRQNGDVTTVSDLIETLCGEGLLLERAPAAEVSDEVRRTADFREQLARLSVYQELSTPAVEARLEGLGLAEVIYPNLPAAPADLGLTAEIWEPFLATVLDLARARGAIARPAEMPEELRQRLPRWINKPLVLRSKPGQDEREDDERPAREVVPLLLATSARPSRLREYAAAVAARCNVNGGGGRLLHAVWDAVRDLATRVNWLKADTASDGYLVNIAKLRVRVHAAPRYIESVSGRLFSRSAAGIAAVGPRPREDLRPLTDDEVATWRSRHAVRRVLDDESLGLASVEHTAQIDVEELDEEEQRFRDGQVNLLACSTTMEMGVDLGGLTLVMMTNVPPGAANYWQRAGRAGRRADGSSLALTLALARPHDQKAFGEPRKFLGEPMVPPQVRFDLPALLLRHVAAQLLTAFFSDAVIASAAGNPMKAFGTVGEFFAVPPTVTHVASAVLELAPDARCLADVFLAWLDGLSEAHPAADATRRLVRGTVLAGRSISELAVQCRDLVADALANVRRDLESIECQRTADAERGDGQENQALLGALRHQERAIENELLIAHLAKNDILPRFGFPLDVVRLETAWRVRDADQIESDSDREGDPALRMERDLKVALAEYVPGAKVLAAKKLHASAGLIPNWRAEAIAQARVSYFVHCARCGYLDIRQIRSEAPCAMCGHSVGTDLEDAPKDIETELGPTPLRQYLVPSSFSVKLGKPPERPEGLAQPERMPPPFVYVSGAGADALFFDVGAGIRMCFESCTTIAFRSEGQLAPSRQRGFGYAVCQRCGRAEPENDWDAPVPKEVRSPHKGLRGGSCSGDLWRHIALGTWTLADTLRLRVGGPFAPALRRTEEEDFYLTLAACLQELVAERLQVDRRTLSTSVGTWKDDDGVHREAIVWDPSTSGLLEHLLPAADEIVRDLVGRLEAEPALLSYVRFDNQFLVAEGRFRLDLVRAHFLDDARKQLLPVQGDKTIPDGLRSDPLRSRAIEALEEGTPPFVLIAPRLADDAFGRDGLLRLVLAMSLRSADSVRLLVREVPDPNKQSQVALAGGLADLIDAGVQVRLTSEPSFFQEPARLLYTRSGVRRALGGVRREGSSWRVTEASFGTGWGMGYLTVEQRGQKADPIFDRFTKTWEASAPVKSATLRPQPSASVHYVAIRDGSTEDNATSLPSLLARRLGPLENAGAVRRLLYVDRYVARSAIAIWNLFRTFEAFAYSRGAQIAVRCLVPNGVSQRPIERVLAEHPRDPLSPAEIDAFCERLGRSKNITPAFQFVPEADAGGARMQHGRVMLIEFEAGGELRSLRIDLDMGMDWLFAKTTRNWSTGTMSAKATHFVLVENYDLEQERVAPRSDWSLAFQRAANPRRR